MVMLTLIAAVLGSCVVLVVLVPRWPALRYSTYAAAMLWSIGLSRAASGPVNWRLAVATSAPWVIIGVIHLTRFGLGWGEE